jgi:hypothetical protein
VYLTAGTGLTRTGGTISINAVEPGITSVGTLTGLASSGTVIISHTVDSTSSTTDSLQVAGGIGVVGTIMGGNMISAKAHNSGAFQMWNGTTNASKRWAMGMLNVQSETGGNVGSDFIIFNYSDTGTFTGSTLSISRVTGNVIIRPTTDSTRTGSLQVAGGAAVARTFTIGAGIVAPNLGMFRNRLINGDMVINQRNVVSGSASGTWVVDRWVQLHTTMTVTASQVAIADLAPFGYAIQYTMPGTAEPNTTLAELVRQNIEGYNIADLLWGTADASLVTVSFFFSCSVVGTYSISSRNAATTRSFVAPITVTTADVWRYYTIAVPGCTTGTWEATNGIGVCPEFNINGTGSATATASTNTWVTGNFVYGTTMTNLAATPNATLRLTGVQFEKGTVATPFEYRFFQTELSLCRRYFEAATLNSSRSNNSPNWLNSFPESIHVTFQVPKRNVPTCTYTNAAQSHAHTLTATENGLMASPPQNGSGNWHLYLTGYTASSEF